MWTKDTKKQMMLLMLFVIVLSMASGCLTDTEGLLVDDGVLTRATAEEYEASLLLSIDGQEDVEVCVQVPHQRLRKSEEEALLEAAIIELEQLFPDTNAGMYNVEKRVRILSAYQDGKVTAKWSFSKENLMLEDGYINENAIEGDCETIEASVLLSCEDSSITHEFGFTVNKVPKSPEEALLERVYMEIAKEGKAEGTVELVLPKEMDGHTLEWKNPKSNMPLQVLLLGSVVVLLYPSVIEERKKEARLKREAQLLREYPEMISKLTLLLGAGMSLRTAWKRIVERYCMAREAGTSRRQLVYEEMLLTQRELESGRGEQTSYRAFGERCGLPKYRRLSNYLMQNMRKGGVGLTELLEQEVADVYAEQRNQVWRFGEEAETKLLFPMLMMLGIVIIIVMIPAFISFKLGVL